MLEDHTMDKKNRSSQTQNKGNASESKKSQDVSTNKQIPKQSRRREPAGSVPKNEGSGRSKPMPQKFKSLDKRPKPRGSLASGKEGSKINLYEDEPELGSLYTPGSKKQNLNHLLNFQYASPAGQYGSVGGRSSYGGRSQSRSVDYSMGYNNYLMQSLASVHKHKYNKEQFLQANCQFVVRAGEDYGVHLADPDQLVKWDFIQQIRGFGDEDVKCPICLDCPRAPQITRCGHCFCWPCILHYLALSDKSWRKCPICYEAVHIGDLKSFTPVIRTPRAVNQEVTFQLMKRERGSTMVSSLAQWHCHAQDIPIRVSETQLDTTYAKLLTASVNDILDMMSGEEAELTLLLDELKREQCPTLCFTERALELLHKRRTELLDKMGKEVRHVTNVGEGQSLKDATQTVGDNLTEPYLETTQAGVLGSGTTLAKLGRSDQTDLGRSDACATGQESSEERLPSDERRQAVSPSDSVAIARVEQCDSVAIARVEKCDSVATESVGELDSVGTAQGWQEEGAAVDVSEIGGAALEHGPHLLEDVASLRDECTAVRVRYESVSSEEPGAHATTSISAEDLYIGPPSHGTTPATPSRFFYFYQAQDGQHLYLHAVNVRMLEMSYGSLERCPPLLTGRILEKETGSMTAELRNRLRYLQHLPVTCQFEVAEIELRPPLVTSDTVDRFRDQLASRERRRLKRAREDKRRAARIDEVEYAQMRGGGGAKYTSSGHRRRLHIESHLQFPECGVGGVPGVSSALASASVSTESSRASSPRRPESPLTTALTALSLDQQDNTSTSFAQRLRAGSSLSSGDNAVFWPSVGERERKRTVSSEEAECSASPAYRLSLAQIMGAKNSPPGQNETTPLTAGGNQNQNSSKKKKRKQQTLLFATGGMVVNK